MTHAFSLIRFLGWLLVAGVLLAGSSAPALAQEGQAQGTGWLCGVVLDEAGGFAPEATLTVLPESKPEGDPPAPVAAASSGPRGGFCFKDLSPGFYDLQVAKGSWLPQLPRRHVEVRAGLVNRLTPIELELEPGDPRVSIAESFDGMPLGQARGMLEELLRKGDRDSLAEAARRLLP
ncbi:MAG: carboxypeptidase-like regulatory domain-containing protein, partial [Candidatus Acidiferrales bacterium]